MKRFWDKVDIRGTDECWPWKAAISPKTGYGGFWLNGQWWLAHRAGWTLTNGPIPTGRHVLHSCDNRPCCNPSHWFLGTPKDNTQDMLAKGRDRLFGGRIYRGGDHPRVKLTEVQIRAIRADQRSCRQIAAAYGLSSSSYVSRIKARQYWRHVP